MLAYFLSHHLSIISITDITLNDSRLEFFKLLFIKKVPKMGNASQLTLTGTTL